MASNKGFLLSVLLISFCMTVLGEELNTFYEAKPPYPHGHYHHGPVVSPALAPSHPPSHHHKGHPPSHAPAQPPIYHHKGHPPSHAPVQPPSHHHKGHPPSKAPAQPPSHHHKGHPPAHPPSHPPAKPPSHPPSKPPSHPPTKPPTLPSRKYVAVQGVVYCKSCKYRGANTLFGASPLSGAIVKLQCNNTRYPQVLQTTTDKNGYFFIHAPKTVTNYGAHKCKVSLVSSPLKTCNKPTDLHGGLSGSRLRPENASGKLPFALYSVEPLAFEPAKWVKCPR